MACATMPAQWLRNERYCSALHIAGENKEATVGRYFLKDFIQTQTLQYNLLRTSKYTLVINLQNYLIRKIFIENVFLWLGTPDRPFNRLVSESWSSLLIHSNFSNFVNCFLLMRCRLIVAFNNEFAKNFIQPEIPHARARSLLPADFWMCVQCPSTIY